jgi:protocatechuate 3,4-dioxygenase beta subunit
MDEDVLRSRLRISRRRALSMGGTIGLGGLLAACGSSGSDSGSGSGPGSGSGSGAKSSLRPSSSAGADIVGLLDTASTCSLAKEETQGPYWFDVDSIRTDIREGRPGTELALALRVQDASSCSSGGKAVAVPNAVVELWHCDAGGAYSGFEGGSAGGRPGGSSGGTSNGSYSKGDSEAKTTDDGTYLRGAQVADANGIVQFTTIYPGWYRGRTTHIHLKVHVDKRTVLTTQLYADDKLTDTVYTASPYSARPGRDTRNADDSIFDKSGVMTIRERGTGYLGLINLGINA